MKIIDLFVKISKDEKVPSRIKSQGLIFEFDEESRQYYEEGRLHNVDSSLRSWLYNFKCLNDEIEIIEEDKKIEKLEPVRGSVLTDLTNKDMVLKNNALIELCKTLNNINNKINELIDEVNKLKGEK